MNLLLSSKVIFRILGLPTHYFFFYLKRSYMEECQEQMTELRKQKIELSRERRRM